MWPFGKKKKEPWSDKFAALAPLVLASDKVMGPHRLPVGFAYRLKPNNPHDSGWIFSSGKETQEELDANPPKICPLALFLKMDPTLGEITDSRWSVPHGSAAAAMRLGKRCTASRGASNEAALRPSAVAALFEGGPRSRWQPAVSAHAQPQISVAPTPRATTGAMPA